MNDKIMVIGSSALVLIMMYIMLSSVERRTTSIPSANDIADGKAWAEYTSDGQRHWVWRKQ